MVLLSDSFVRGVNGGSPPASLQAPFPSQIHKVTAVAQELFLWLFIGMRASARSQRLLNHGEQDTTEGSHELKPADRQGHEERRSRKGGMKFKVGGGGGDSDNMGWVESQDKRSLREGSNVVREIQYV